MTCEEVRISLGVYVLGALDPEEAAKVEAHLDRCPSCRAEHAELAGLPAVLARVSEQDIAHAVAPPRAVLDRMLAASARRNRRSRVLLGIAAGVVTVALGGTAWLAASGQGDRVTSAAAGSASAADAPRVEARPDAADAALPLMASPGTGTTGGVTPAPHGTAPPGGDVVSTTEARGSNGDVRLAVRLIARESGTQIVARISGVPAGTVCSLRVIGLNGAATRVGSWSVGAGEYRGSGNTVFEASTSLRPADIERFELTGGDGRTLVTAPVPRSSPSGG